MLVLMSWESSADSRTAGGGSSDLNLYSTISWASCNIHTHIHSYSAQQSTALVIYWILCLHSVLFETPETKVAVEAAGGPLGTLMESVSTFESPSLIH